MLCLPLCQELLGTIDSGSQSSLGGGYPLSTWQTIDAHGKFSGIANNATSAHNATGGMKLIAKKVPQPISAEGWIKYIKVHSGSCLIYRFRSIMFSVKQIFQVPFRKTTIQLSSPRLHLNTSPPIHTPNSTVPPHKRTSSYIHTHTHAHSQYSLGKKTFPLNGSCTVNCATFVFLSTLFPFDLTTYTLLTVKNFLMRL